MTHASPGRLYRAALQMHNEQENAVLGPIQAGGHWADSKRHSTGAFYTPAHLVRFVVTHTLYPTLQTWARQVQQAYPSGDQQLLADLRQTVVGLQVVDPACGCGRFLLDAFRVLRDFHVWLARHEGRLCASAGNKWLVAGFELRAESKDRWEQAWCIGTLRALGCLRGYDLNPRAVAATQATLLHMAGLVDGPAGTAAAVAHQLLQEQIQVNDTLADNDIADPAYAPQLLLCEAPTPREPNWHIVIGNPPWGAAGAHRGVARRLGLPISNVNSFGLFLINCVAKLPLGGRLGFVLPRNFCKGDDYTAIRQRLLQDTTLEWLADAGQAFPGVTQEVVALVLRRVAQVEPSTPVCLTQVSSASPTGAAVHSINLGHFASAPGHIFTLNAHAEHFDVLTQMEQQAQMTLRAAVTWARGVEYGRNGALIRCPYCEAFTSAPKKKQAQKSCPTCNALLANQEVAYRLITAEADQKHNVPIYAGRHVRRYWLDTPDYIDLHVPGVTYKDSGLFSSPKLLIPKIAPYIAAMVETVGAWTTQGVYMLRPKVALWDVYALLGVLNSAPLAFYYEFRYNDGAKLTTNVTLAHLLELPLPGVTDSARLQQIARGAKQLCAAQLPVAQVAQHPVNHQIDMAVCQLFSLTPQQTAFVMDWREGQSSF